MLLTLLLTACSEKPQVVYKTVYIFPPEAYLVPCDKPTLEGKTWADIGRLAIKRGTSLDACAGRVDGIIEWRDKKKKEEGGN